ncbi:MAG: protein kinase domain-containing protein [Desulfatibacillaceae bacterium]
MEDAVKQCLPTYRVLETLGEGVHGVVYHIADDLKERAVKVVPLMVERSRTHRTSTDLDSKISQDYHAVREYYEAIQGPGVLKVYDFHLVGKQVSEHKAKACLVILMELCPENLRDHVLDMDHPMEAPRALALMAELAGVLGRLTDECGDTFLFTDLKPSNLLFTATGELVVGDLGGLKRLGSVSSVAKAQFTPNWAAPETLMHADAPTVPGIVYSYGLVAHFLWEGALPYEKLDFIQRISAIREKGVEFTRKDMPEDVRTLIRRCLAPAADQRPPGFMAVLEALGKIVLARPGGASRPITETGSSRDAGPEQPPSTGTAVPETTEPDPVPTDSSGPGYPGTEQGEPEPALIGRATSAPQEPTDLEAETGDIPPLGKPESPETRTPVDPAPNEDTVDRFIRSGGLEGYEPDDEPESEPGAHGEREPARIEDTPSGTTTVDDSKKDMETGAPERLRHTPRTGTAEGSTEIGITSAGAVVALDDNGFESEGMYISQGAAVASTIRGPGLERDSSLLPYGEPEKTPEPDPGDRTVSRDLVESGLETHEQSRACPSCGRVNRLPASGDSTAGLRCGACGQALAAGGREALQTTAVLLLPALGWLVGCLLEWSLPSPPGLGPVTFPVSWAAAGLLTGAGVWCALPGFPPARVILVWFSWMVCGLLVVPLGPAWPAAWAMGAILTTAVVRQEYFDFTPRLAAWTSVGWAVCLVAALLVNQAGWRLILGTAPTARDLAPMWYGLRVGLVQGTGALFGMWVFLRVVDGLRRTSEPSGRLADPGLSEAA